MRIETLEEFATLARTLSYRRAAKALFIQPPTLSKHIRKLEEDLGVVLFDRDTHGVALTEDGARIYTRCREVLDAYEAMRNETRSGRAEVRFGVPLKYTLYSDFVARAVEAAGEHLPTIEVRVIETGVAGDVFSLLAHDCDVVLQTYSSDWEEGRIGCVKLRKYRASAWINASNPLAQRSSISIMELANMVYRLADTPESPFTREVLAQMSRYGFVPVMGELVDDQYRIGANEYGIVYGGDPSAAFGPRVVKVPLEEELEFWMTAVYHTNKMTRELRGFLGVLEWTARQQDA